MTIGFSVPVPYVPVSHQGHAVNQEIGKFVIYTEAGGFQWNTLDCTEQGALAKRQSPTPTDQVAEIKFIPQA